MNALLFDNLLSWSAQVAILAIMAAPATCVLRHSRARLYFWQAILVVALTLPAIAPWKQSVDVALPLPPPVVLGSHGVPVSNAPSSITWGFEQLLVLLAAGAVLRLAWVVVGLLRLSSIRKQARLLQNPPVVFGGNASWYLSDQVSGPVTFGWLKPTVVLPAKFCELTPDAQEAIAIHELFHVHRRDWLFVMAEEIVRSILWFHPAVWFVLSRIQLAREQVVDQEVVHATRDRAGYLQALISAAEQKLLTDVAPAPLFLKKRQLAVRVQSLLQETSMSATRLAAHISVAAAVAVLGACAAIWFFPLRAAAQLLPDDPGITVDAGAALAHRAPVHNPTAITGDVLLELKLNSKGEVADARVLSGPDELRKPALASVLEWHYAAETAPPALVHATIHFGDRSASAAITPQAPPPPPPPPPPGAGRGIGAGIGGGIGGGRGPGLRGGVATPPAPPPPPPPPPETAVVQRIDFAGLSPELQQRVQNSLTVHAGDTLRLTEWESLREALRNIDEHLSMIVQGNGNSPDARVTLRIALRPEEVRGGFAPRQAVRVGGGAAPVPIVQIEPQYSEEARAAKWQGTVLLQVTIDENGLPQDIKIVRPLGMGLDGQAIEAVQQWRFQPSHLNGKPVAVTANIEVHFHL